MEKSRQERTIFREGEISRLAQAARVAKTPPLWTRTHEKWVWKRERDGQAGKIGDVRRRRRRQRRRRRRQLRADSSFSERLRIRVYRERMYYKREERHYKTGEHGLGVHDYVCSNKDYLTRKLRGAERTWRCWWWRWRCSGLFRGLFTAIAQ